MVIKKRSATKQWELEHPDDKPCPRDRKAAGAWRRARGIGVPYADRAKWEEYNRLIREKRGREGKQT